MIRRPRRRPAQRCPGPRRSCSRRPHTAAPGCRRCTTPRRRLRAGRGAAAAGMRPRRANPPWKVLRSRGRAQEGRVGAQAGRAGRAVCRASCLGRWVPGRTSKVIKELLCRRRRGRAGLLAFWAACLPHRHRCFTRRTCDAVPRALCVLPPPVANTQTCNSDVTALEQLLLQASGLAPRAEGPRRMRPPAPRGLACPSLTLQQQRRLGPPAHLPFTLSSSTSNTRVAPPGITLPAPRSPAGAGTVGAGPQGVARGSCAGRAACAGPCCEPAPGPRTVAQVRGDHQLPLFAHAHALDALVPAWG